MMGRAVAAPNVPGAAATPELTPEAEPEPDGGQAAAGETEPGEDAAAPQVEQSKVGEVAVIRPEISATTLEAAQSLTPQGAAASLAGQREYPRRFARRLDSACLDLVRERSDRGVIEAAPAAHPTALLPGADQGRAVETEGWPRRRFRLAPGLGLKAAHRGRSVLPIRNLSMACAAWRPSRIAQTTSDWPRRISPAANTFEREVR